VVDDEPDSWHPFIDAMADTAACRLPPAACRLQPGLVVAVCTAATVQVQGCAALT